MALLREVNAFNAMIARNVSTRLVTKLAPLDNAAIAARTGADPLVFTGGLASRKRDYLQYQRLWQQRGVPTYLVDTGMGFNPIRRNAEEVLRTINQALNETGARRAWVGGQSKGTLDTRWALQNHPEVLDQVHGALLIVGPHHGGLTTSEAAAGAIRGSMGVAPRPLRDHLRATSELMLGSRELRELDEGLVPFLDDAPEHFTIYNVSTNVFPNSRLLPAHDWLVPLNSQRLVDHPKVIEHELVGGALNHVTAHTNDETLTLMDTAMRSVP